ncbi:hypothetical protein WJX75_000131 [Coccomyxa subellipsoidea]|uniref:Uncharacterized protein n=1 Tax=Coccomyxa subellipsoidea TaxID=248742 RepID=A0ABR2YQR2_9CHLO
MNGNVFVDLSPHQKHGKACTWIALERSVQGCVHGDLSEPVSSCTTPVSTRRLRHFANEGRNISAEHLKA